MLLPGDPIPAPNGACPNYGDHAPPSATAVPATKHPLCTQLCVLDCLGQTGQRRGRADARPMTNVTEKQPRTEAQILCQIMANERAGGSAGLAGSAELGNSHRLTQGWYLAHREGYTAREMSLVTRAPTHSERKKTRLQPARPLPSWVSAGACDFLNGYSMSSRPTPRWFRAPFCPLQTHALRQVS